MTNRVLIVCAGVLFGLTASASAQVAITATTPTPKYEVSFGYQLFRAGEVCGEEQVVNGQVVETCFPDRVFPFGLAGDFVYNFGSIGLGVVGQGGWSRDSEDDLNFRSRQVAGGLRWTSRRAMRFAPFGQFLIGGIFSSLSVDDDGDDDDDDNGTSNFMIMPGVGAVFAASGTWGFVGQVDLQRVFIDEGDNFDTSRNDIRVFLGVRLSIR
jgi:hypothetical protein